jgi:hypothetical protein
LTGILTTLDSSFHFLYGLNLLTDLVNADDLYRLYNLDGPANADNLYRWNRLYDSVNVDTGPFPFHLLFLYEIDLEEG